jgi:hypothetical protein
MKYRNLQKDEIVQAGDEMDASNTWKDPIKWIQVGPETIGRVVSDPQYPAHQRFRRPLIDKDTVV